MDHTFQISYTSMVFMWNHLSHRSFMDLKNHLVQSSASSFADGAHHNHFHVEFHKGGVVGGDGEVPAVLKSGEVVIDTDSSEYGPC